MDTQLCVSCHIDQAPLDGLVGRLQSHLQAPFIFHTDNLSLLILTVKYKISMYKTPNSVAVSCRNQSTSKLLYNAHFLLNTICHNTVFDMNLSVKNATICADSTHGRVTDRCLQEIYISQTFLTIHMPFGTPNFHFYILSGLTPPDYHEEVIQTQEGSPIPIHPRDIDCSLTSQDPSQVNTNESERDNEIFQISSGKSRHKNTSIDHMYLYMNRHYLNAY